ncbi:unnamed protein product [Ceratitis capitata]|uniref:(Mediterranean fruit fly) hypothetical protein n=1 Tax=Ceratitis capitata TaxID=7213 RepID=A0A811UF01_CERCA|nr:unnamed protein product [Ceratitis capitata]
MVGACDKTEWIQTRRPAAWNSAGRQLAISGNQAVTQTGHTHQIWRAYEPFAPIINNIRVHARILLGILVVTLPVVVAAVAMAVAQSVVVAIRASASIQEALLSSADRVLLISCTQRPRSKHWGRAMS